MKKVIFFSIIALSVFIIQSLIHSIYTLWQKQALVENAQKQLVQEQKTNQLLKKEAIRVSTTQFIEEQARDKLLLRKPNEQTVLLPQNPVLPKNEAKKQQKSHWQAWIALFTEKE